MTIQKCTFFPAYTSQSELKAFEHNSLLLFALQIKFDIEDISSAGADSITDGDDDKKIDMIYIDEDDGIVVIAQSYLAQDTTKKSAPSNKASDLNTGVSWLLNRTVEELPISLKSHANEIRNLLNENKINAIYVWYVHNLLESENVAQEMKTVDQTVKSALSANYPDSNVTNIYSFEIGIETIEDWYKSILTPILVHEKFKIDIPGGYEIKHGEWTSYVTSISANWLYKAFSKFGTDLFSANVREYLGSKRSDANINHGIKLTAEKDPGNFWVYNNGLTILVHNYDYNNNLNSLSIEGFSIVNGAQTTGAIGSLKTAPSANAKIPVRFIKCNNQNLIYDIVRYNNSQNKITAPDFRSNDSIQKRLVEEFQKVSDLTYTARRGGRDDIVKKDPKTIMSVTAGQALASLGNDPDVAYHKKNKIWEDDKLYSKYFNDATNAKNIFFAYSLLRTIELKKLNLVAKSKNGLLTREEKTQLEFFRKRGSIHMFISAISRCLEILLSKPIPSIYRIHFNTDVTLSDAIKLWTPIIDSVIPFVNHLSEGLADGFRNSESVNKSINTFASLVEATKQPNTDVYKSFADNVN